ncbi:hypothetical protein GR198_06830 [Rhizobium leguminosarum]|uniref:hypothetical protein n=1 Tax=Rhizobium leguminosarum TaxID=384 RepID=UPI0013C05F05|nr:hypothetical protein [Rhizobium leguminosarum]NEH55459.1 hypothetical protein [Rhizobium leguminosarum]
MDENPDPIPLVNDAAREAVDAMRGYSYQILHSIEAWLDLAVGEILVLEGAEDLDRIYASGATVEQVKDTPGSGSLTLRSPNALKAIGNFWQHGRRNPSTTIQFRYLTTSGIGQERGETLSALGAPGIEVWEDIRRAPRASASLANAKVIQDYLAVSDVLPRSLREFLAEAAVDIVIARIIQPIEWITSRPGADALCRRIEARLIELGEPRNIGAAAAARALARLYLEAWTNATDHAREPLRRGDLIRILEDAGTTRVPDALLMELLKQITGTASSQAAVTHLDRAITKPPRPPLRRFGRQDLEEGIGKALLRGAVYIHGSTGTGKTLLAAAAVAASEAVGWIDLRDLDRQAVVARLHAAVQFVDAHAGRMTVVLDDFDPGDDPRPILPGLQRLVASLSTSGGGLLITGAHRLPPRLASAINLTEKGIFQAPSFETAEITVYFRSAGCPAEDADNWSKIVHASTSGHPQLVDARLAALQQQNWPKPSVGEWLAPTLDVADVRTEARRMVSSLPEDQREMLSRASLVMGRISRKRLLAVGGITPAIVESGHTIDRLTGPWLEVTDTADLRVSPLLRGLGGEIRGSIWTEDMHASIAWAWLAERSLTAGDVSTLLMHAMLSKQMGPLVHILPSLLEASAEVWEQIGETAGFFAMIGVDEGHDSPFPAAVDTAVFRILQLRVAAEVQEVQIRAIVTRALQEIDSRKDVDLASDFFDFLFLWQVIRVETIMRNIEFAVSVGRRFRRVMENVGRGLAAIDHDDREVLEVFPDLSPVFALSLMPSLPDVAAFNEFLATVEPLELEDRQFILPGLSGGNDAAAVMLDRLWLSEIAKPVPDWIGLAAALRRAMSIALKSDLPRLADTAAARLVRVTDEDLKDPAAAMSAADAAATQIGDPVRVLAAKAKVLYRLERSSEALKIYEQILPALEVSPSYRAEILRDAALAAAQTKAWPLCARRFGEALSLLGAQDPAERQVGFGVDYALTLALAGDQRAAVAAFGVALDRILEDGRERPPEPFLSVRQLGSEAIKRVQMIITAIPSQKHDDLESLVGRASSLDPLRWDDQRPASVALLARQVLDLQLSIVDYDPAAIAHLATWIRQSRDVAVVGTNWETFTRLAVITGDVAPVIRDAIRETAYFVRLRILYEAGQDPYEQLENEPPTPQLSEAAGFLIICRILAVIVSLMAKDTLRSLPLQGWRGDLPADPSYDQLRSFLTDVEDHLFGPDDPISELFGKHSTWETRILRSLGALARQRSADELLTAQTVLALGLNQPQLVAVIAEPLSELVTQAWERLCSVPALMAMPRLSVPNIRAAVSATPSGWTRTKAVLHAALSAVSSRTARDLRDFVAAIKE